MSSNSSLKHGYAKRQTKLNFFESEKNDPVVENTSVTSRYFLTISHLLAKYDPTLQQHLLG